MLAALERDAAERRALRGVGHFAIDGPGGSRRAKQVLVTEPPYRWRIEILGLLDQTIGLFVSDGRRYRLTQSDRSIETGEVDDTTFHDLTSGIDLTPGGVGSVLLAAPYFEAPRAARATTLPEGGVRIVATGDVLYEGQQLEFDADGHLRRWSVGDTLEARYGDLRPLADGVVFPHEVELIDHVRGASLRVTWSRVELNPTLSPGLFEW
jgi:hypothetical protein